MASINPVELSTALNQLNKKIQGELEEERASRFTFDPEVEVEYDEDIDKKIKAISEALNDYGYVVEVTENIDTVDVSKNNKFNVKISNLDGCYVNIDLFDYKKVMLDYTLSEEEYIEKELEKIGGVNIKNISSISKLICEYISYACYFGDELQIKLYNDIGWAIYNNQRIFKYDTIYAKSNEENKPILSKCINSIGKELHSIRPSELKDNANNRIFDIYENLHWIKEFLPIFEYRDAGTEGKPKEGRPYVALILAAACTGLIRPRLSFTKETNININIVGKGGSGKSTICHVALSLFGNPEQLEGSFVDSDEAAEIIRVKRPVIPYILDERMLKVENESEKAKRQKVLINVFREYEGKVKERMAGSDRELSGQRTYAPIISSSVEPMMNILLQVGQDLGQYRRFIELYTTKGDLFKGRKEAQFAEKFASSKYGHGVELMVRFMLDHYNDEGINNIFNQILDNVNKALEIREKAENELGNSSVNNLGSSAMRFALIITSLTILEMTLKQYVLDHELMIKENAEHGKYPEDFTELLERYKTEENDNVLGREVLSILIDNLVDKMKKVGLKFNVYDNMIAFYNNHKALFAEKQTHYADDVSSKKYSYFGYREVNSGTVTFGFKHYRGLEWIAANDYDNMTDEQLLSYVRKACEYDKGKKELIQFISENIGEYANRELADAIYEKEKKYISIDYIEMGKIKGGIAITLKRKDIDPEDYKDSDLVEKKETKKKTTKSKEETK